MEENNSFKPYVSADKVLPEFTPSSIIIGVLLAIVFGATNAYLGLRVGMTVSASIPAAVIGMGVYKLIGRFSTKKDDTILKATWCRRSVLPVSLWQLVRSLRCRHCFCGQLKVRHRCLVLWRSL